MLAATVIALLGLTACTAQIDDGLPSADHVDLATDTAIRSTILDFSHDGWLAVSRVIDDNNRSDAVLLFLPVAEGSPFSAAKRLLQLTNGEEMLVTDVDQSDRYVAAAIQGSSPREGRIVVWDRKTGELALQFDFSIGDSDVTDLATHVVFSADGSTLMARNVIGEIAAWDIATAVQLYRTQLNPGLGPYRLDEQTVVVTYANPTNVDETLMEARNIATGTTVWAQSIEGDVQQLAVSDESHRIALLVDGSLTIFDNAGTAQGAPVDVDEEPLDMVFNRDGSAVTIATLQGGLVTVRAGAVEERAAIRESITALAWSPVEPLLLAIPSVDVGAYWRADNVMAWRLGHV